MKGYRKVYRRQLVAGLQERIARERNGFRLLLLFSWLMDAKGLPA